MDGAWYVAQYPDAAASGLDPTQYYDQVGWKLGENPDPWFDTKYYLTVNPDVAAAGVNPLQHFEQSGWKEGASRHSPSTTRRISPRIPTSPRPA